MDSKELAKVDQQKAVLARATEQVRRIKPTASVKLVVRCHNVGLLGKNTEKTIELREVHGIALESIVRWREDGLSFQRISLCLQARDSYFEPNCSLKLIHGYLSVLGFNESGTYGSIPAEVDSLLSAFSDLSEKIGGRYPMHTLMRRIQELWQGRALEAYHACLQDEDQFVELIRGRMDLTTFKRRLARGTTTYDFDDRRDDDGIGDDFGDDPAIRRLISDASF